jgi:hypothetical protein
VIALCDDATTLCPTEARPLLPSLTQPVPSLHFFVDSSLARARAHVYRVVGDGSDSIQLVRVERGNWVCSVCADVVPVRCRTPARSISVLHHAATCVCFSLPRVLFS